jgi:hypothetical protein
VDCVGTKVKRKTIFFPWKLFILAPAIKIDSDNNIPNDFIAHAEGVYQE